MYIGTSSVNRVNATPFPQLHLRKGRKCMKKLLVHWQKTVFKLIVVLVNRLGRVFLRKGAPLPMASMLRERTGEMKNPSHIKIPPQLFS